MTSKKTGAVQVDQWDSTQKPDMDLIKSRLKDSETLQNGNFS